ncbi:MAG: substrate-binding domain-containing protein [Gammaproteobacteria bacterium]
MNSFKKLISPLLLISSLLFNPAPSAQADTTVLRMATTTSTENSGLLAVLNPPFEKRYGVRLDVLAVGTGKALRLGENGDVDLVLVHAPEAEKAFVEAGQGVERIPVMHNDFVIAGPPTDEAGVKNAPDAVSALKSIAERHAGFISRGDDSGTHKKELALWRAAETTPQAPWYVAAGQGMGAVLTMADEKNAYTLTDRGTYLAYRDKIGLTIVFEGDQALYNPYHVIAVNPENHRHVNYDLAQKYIRFLVGAEGQAIIQNFTAGGQRLFYPDAGN